jgi:DNA-binding NarL/FixJ family response regulator
MNPPRLLSVLVVDDSALVRARLRRLLEESDSRCVVMEAATVADAARALQSLRPDVVVLDLSLPDGSGFDLLPRVKRAAPRCAVILLTNHEGPDICQRALSLGADHYFRKSTEFELVPIVMQRVAARLRTGETSNANSSNPVKGSRQ